MTGRVTGSCHLGCGQCCTQAVIPAVIPVKDSEDVVRENPVRLQDPAPDNPDWRAFCEARGWVRENGTLVIDLDGPRPVRLGTYHGALAVYLKHRCPQLRDDLTCRLHGTPHYPEVCRRFPTPLDDLYPFPDCSYAIEVTPGQGQGP